MVTMKRPHHIRISLVFGLALVLLLALGASSALAAPEGYNATPPVQGADALGLAPGYLDAPGGWTCMGLTTRNSVRFQHVYDFSCDAPGSVPTTFPDGSFSGIGYIRVLGIDWLSWNPQILGKHLAYVPYGVMITFKQPVAAAGVVAEPNPFDWIDFNIQAFNTQGQRIGSFTRSINGWYGAAFIGMWSYTANIKYIIVDCTPDFCFSDLTYGARPWGNPTRGHTRY